MLTDDQLSKILTDSKLLSAKDLRNAKERQRNVEGEKNAANGGYGQSLAVVVGAVGRYCCHGNQPVLCEFPWRPGHAAPPVEEEDNKPALRGHCIFIQP